jgi:hypothetical protein
VAGPARTAALAGRTAPPAARLRPSTPARARPGHPAARQPAGITEDKGLAAYLAEFVGTLLLVLAITGFVSASAFTSLNLLALAVVHGLVLMALVNSIGSISGAHVNPAVTLSLLALRKVSGRDAAGYSSTCRAAAWGSPSWPRRSARSR